MPNPAPARQTRRRRRAPALLVASLAIAIALHSCTGLMTVTQQASLAPRPATAVEPISQSIVGELPSLSKENFGKWVEHPRVVSWSRSLPRSVLPRDWKEAALNLGAMPGAAEIAIGAGFHIVRRDDGTVWRWGIQTPCDITQDPGSYATELERISGLPPAVAIAAGPCHVLVLAEDGGVWAWGANQLGQVGDGSLRYRRNPVRVRELDNVVAIAAGGDHSLAVRRDGTVWAWGSGAHGALGTGSVSSTSRPLRVPGLSKVVAVAAGSWHSLTLTDDGQVWTWGGRTYLRADAAPDLSRALPAQVPGLTDVVKIAAGTRHSLALRADGSVWAWGANELGQVDPDSAPDDHPEPARVEGLPVILVISGGDHHSLALAPDSTVWAWGYDGPRLPDSEATPPLIDIHVRAVPALAGASAIAAGPDLSLAILGPRRRALPAPVFR